MSNKYIDWLMVLLVIIALMLCTQVCQAESSQLRFSWESVTLNADGTPCSDLAGYALYRSREANNWESFTGIEPSFIRVDADKTFVALTCPEPGEWYWVIRAFDTTGHYSDISEVLHVNVDIMRPGSVFHFRTCQKGDINCDGDIDSSDIAEFLNVIK